jgi:hypothetical protein
MLTNQMVLFLLLFLLYFFKVDASLWNLPRIRNNILRIYVVNYTKHVKKGIFNKIYHLLNKTSDTLNIYLMDTNSKYYSLSEEERILLENIITFMF